MKNLLFLPVVIPLATAVLIMLFGRRTPARRLLAVIGCVLLLASALVLLVDVWREGVIAVQLGNWRAPFGITFVADVFSAVMVVMTGIIGLAVVIYSLPAIDLRREAFGYYVLFHVMLMGVCGAFLTGDMFNLYVWFEVMLIASFVLAALGGQPRQVEGAIKYVTLNLLSSAMFLAAVGLLYGVTGALNMADLATRLPESPYPGLILTIATMFFIAFGIKAAVFPLFAWLPASYHTPPPAVSAVFAGLLTKVGVYAMIRVFTLMFLQDVTFVQSLVLFIAAMTMVVGAVGAIAQVDIRRALSFLLISHIGYIVMGLGLLTPLGLAGAVLYLVHHILVICNLFLVSGIILKLTGTLQLRRLGGLWATQPALAILYLIPAFALSGVPPFSGFWPKLMLVQAALQQHQYAVVAAALAASLLTLMVLARIFMEAFWKPCPEEAPPVRFSLGTSYDQLALLSPLVALTILSLSIGLWAQPLVDVSSRAASQLLNAQNYVRIVLQEQ